MVECENLMVVFLVLWSLWLYKYHFVIECNKLTSSRSKLYSKVTESVPNFLVMSDSDKFKYILSRNDYDIMKICVIGISDMCSERNKLLKSNAN